jgi:hypothetical protein
VRKKTLFDIWLLQDVDTADEMIKLVSLKALNTEKYCNYSGNRNVFILMEIVF